MSKLLLLKLGQALPSLIQNNNDFEHLISKGIGFEKEDCIIVEPSKGDAFPDIDQFNSIILTGSSSMLTEPPEWTNSLLNWLDKIISYEIPTLGICYGHQVLGCLLGANVDWNSNGRELGNHKVTLTEEGQKNPLYADLPKEMEIIAIHSQSLSTLPGEAKLLAYNSHDKIQSFVWKDYVWGTQFHPEFTDPVISTYFDECSDEYLEEGFELEALKQNLTNSHHGKNILKNFSTIIRNQTK